jgi:predicted dehydrogenase
LDDVDQLLNQSANVVITKPWKQERFESFVRVASPNMHPKLAIEAFEVGLHVWMEKPAGASVADVKKMIASRADRICVVGLKKAFMPATRKAVELLSEEIKEPIRSGLAIYPSQSSISSTR